MSNDKEENNNVIQMKFKENEKLESEINDFDEVEDENFEPQEESIEDSDSNDRMIAKDYLSTVVEQSDRIVYYEIERIYKNDKNREYKNKFKLKKEPPVLVIKDNLGGEVSFDLTEKLTKELISGLKEVDRAYSGFSGPADLDAPENWKDKIVYYVKKNPIKFMFPVAILIIVTILSIL